MESRTDALHALDQIAETNRSVADRLITPIWYHPLLGLLITGFTIAYALGPAIVRILAVVLYVVGIVALKNAYQHRTGVWISGFRAGPAKIWAIALSSTTGVGLVAAMVLAALTDRVLPIVGISVLLMVATMVLGRRFDVAVREDLRNRP